MGSAALTRLDRAAHAIVARLQAARFVFLWLALALGAASWLMRAWTEHAEGRRFSYAVNDMLLNYGYGPARRGLGSRLPSRWPSALAGRRACGRQH